MLSDVLPSSSDDGRERREIYFTRGFFVLDQNCFWLISCSSSCPSILDCFSFSKNLYPEHVSWLLTSPLYKKTKQKFLSFQRRVQRDDNNCHNNKMMRWRENLKRNWTTFGCFFLFSHIAHWYFCSASFNRTVHHEGGGRGLEGEILIKRNSRDQKFYNEPKQNSISRVCRLLFACSWDIKENGGGGEIDWTKGNARIATDSPICHAKQSNKKCEKW